MMNRSSGKAASWLVGALATALVGLVVVETGLYAKARRAARGLVAGESEPEFRSDLADPESQRIARERTAEILAQRDTVMPPELQREVMTVYHDLRVWQNMWYLGIRIQKNPCDLWMMQQILTEVRPDYVIETGTLYGGSALYWAHILDGLGLEGSKVITIDIEERCQNAAERPLWKEHVEFVLSSSTDPDTIAAIGERVRGKKVVVVLDALHTRDHVLDELRAYGPMVSPGSYIVAEDTNMDGVPVKPDFGPGPMTAVNDYLAEGGADLFEVDLDREAMILTFNPGGWLRRKGGPPGQ